MNPLFKISPVLFALLAAGCNDNGSTSSPNPSAKVSVAANGLNVNTLTLTNTGAVNISSITAPQFSGALSSTLTVNTASSSCANVTFPLTPGSSCTYVFRASETSNTVPGVQTGTIRFSLAFADGTSKNESLPTTLTHYLYAGNRTGVHAWNGSVWSMVGSGPTHVASLLSAPDSNGNTVLYAGSSTNTSGQDLQIWNGSTWTPSSGSPTNVQALAYTATNNVNTLFSGSLVNTAGSDNLNRYANNAWSALGSTLSEIDSLATSSATDGTLYVGSIIGNPSGDVYAYSGGSVSQLSGGPSYVDALTYDRSNSLLYAGSVLNRSSSDTGVNAWNGTSWSAVGTGAPSGVHALTLNGTRLYAVGNTALDANYTWAQLNTLGMQNWRSTTSSEDGSHLFGVAGTNPNIYVSDDYGLTWTPHPVSSSNLSNPEIVSSADGTHLAVADRNSEYVYTSSDSGVTWNRNTLPNGSVSGGLIASSATGQYLATIAGGSIYLSNDYGANWTLQSNTVPTSAAWKGIFISQDGTTIIAITEAGQVWKTTDSGQSWANISRVPTIPAVSKVTFSVDSSHLFALKSSSGNIYASMDSGQTWTQLLNPPSAVIGITCSADGSHVAAWSADTLYVSADYGQTWTPTPPLGTSRWVTNNNVASNAINFSADGSHLFAAPFNSLAYIGALPDINVYDNDAWTTVTGNGAEPSGTHAIIVDSASNIYTGGVANTILGSLGGKDVNILHNNAWSALGSADTPVNVIALALGTEVQIDTAAS